MFSMHCSSNKLNNPAKKEHELKQQLMARRMTNNANSTAEMAEGAAMLLKLWQAYAYWNGMQN